MGWNVFCLEWRILKKDRASLAVLAVFALFLTFASIAGGLQADRLSGGLKAGMIEEQLRLASHKKDLELLRAMDKPLSSRDPRNTVWMGQQGAARLAVLSPSPLASVALGQRELYPQAIRVSTGISLIREKETQTPLMGPTRLRTGTFDPAFLFVVLFPLVVIALSYELLSGERERGTLAMLLSQPVSQSALVIGKASARMVALGGVTIGFALLGLLLAGAELEVARAWVHVVLYLGVLLCWAIFWFALSVVVNASGGGSAKNALVLVGIWLALVVVVPGLVGSALNSFYPPPSKMDLIHEAREATQEIERELNELEGRHDVDPKRGQPAKQIDGIQEALLKRSEPVLRAMSERLQERQTVLENTRYLSPAIIVSLMLEDIAGSGAVRHQRFQDQVSVYHKEFRAFFSQRIAKDQKLTLVDLEEIPNFQYEEEDLGVLVSRVSVNLALLLVVTVLLLLLARRGLKQVIIAR